ncbi:MAG: sulfatase-like hydrolase/transferase [Myxococcaceae bacterium]
MRALFRRLRPYLYSALAGALFFLALFIGETVLLVQAGAVGLKMDTSGPFAALFAAVKPAVPSLIARIVLVYLLAGATLLVLARLVVDATRFPRKILGTVAVACVIFALLLWHAAISRPALFDDLPFAQSLWSYFAEHGSPSHPLYVAAVLMLGVGAFAFRSRRRRIVGTAAVVVAGTLTAGAVFVTRPPLQHSPLVVLIGIDAFRPDRLSANGSDKGVAPNLDAFLTDAVLFDRAYTPVAQTEPAWRSLLTARWPNRTGVRYSLTPDSSIVQLPTFVQSFANAGFSTSFRTDCSRFHYEGPASGFSIREEPPRGAVNFLLEKLRYRMVGVFAANSAGSWLLPEMVDNRALAGIHDPFAFADRLSDKLVAEAEQGPALFAFHATAAHFPGDPTYPYYRQFADGDAPLARRLRMVFSPVVKGAVRTDGATKKGSEALYDALLAQADAQVGQLITALQEEGLYDDATIVVFSDHGESFYADAPELQGSTSVHGARLDEEENRILLAVKLPHHKAATTRVKQLVRLVDIGPTLLELYGLPPLPNTEGESFAAAFDGRPISSRKLYAETGFTHVSPDVFDADHRADAPRSFDAYSVRPDGIVELAATAHDRVIGEKDIGAFDGTGWIIRSPKKDGTIAEKCVGTCEPGLSEWLDEATK